MIPHTLLSYLRNAHLLSLDVVAGAVFCHLMFVKLPDGNTPLHWVPALALACCVFLIYQTDRYLDLKKNPKLTTPRHRFVAKYIVWLKKIGLGLFLSLVVLVFFLPNQLLYLGFGLLLALGLYFWLLNRLGVHHILHARKEIIVAIIYTAGVWGSAAVLKPTLSAYDWVVGSIFLMLAFQNLLLFSWMEAFDADEANSLAISLGEETTQQVLTGFSVIITLLVMIFFVSNTSIYQKRLLCIEWLMSLGLLYIAKNPNFFKQAERYRWAGDMVFLLAMVL